MKLNQPKGEIDMLNGPLRKGIFLYAVPVALCLFLQLLYNALDTIIVGRFLGDEALAVMGAATPLTSLFVKAFSAFSIGASIAVAQGIGANDDATAAAASRTAVLLGIASGLAAGIVGVLFSRPMLSGSNCPQGIMDIATTYTCLYFVSMPATSIYFFCTAVMRAMGDTKTPLNILLASSVTHVAVSLLTVVALRMGVAGVAISTIVSQTQAAVVIMLRLGKTEGPCRLNLRKLSFDLAQLKKIIVVGVPATIQSFLMSFSNVVIQSAINSFGETVMAGAAAAESVLNIVVNPASEGVVQATVVFVSQNYGAKKLNRVRKSCHEAYVVVFALTMALGVLTTLFSRQLLGLYTTGTGAIDTGHVRVWVECLSYFLCGFQGVVCAAMRGMNYSIYPLLSSAIGTCLLRWIWIKTVFALCPTLVMLYMCYPVSWLITFVFQEIMFRKLTKDMA